MLSIARADSPPTACWRARRARSQPGDFSTYTLRLVQTPTHRRRRRPASTRCSSRSSSPSRSSVRPTSTARRRLRVLREPARRAGDQLPREGLRQLPPPDARPHGACCCRSGGSATPPTSASRWSKLLAYVGDHLSYQQDASRPRPISARRGAASRCAGTRASSTTSCTTAATRARGCMLRRRRTAACAAPTARTDCCYARLARAARRGSTRHRGPTSERLTDEAVGLRDRCTTCSALPGAQRDAFLHVGRRASCCLPQGATRATLIVTRMRISARACGRAMCSSSSRCSARRRETRPTPIRRIATPCG